ncbi:neprilysin-21 isoform X2 [Rhipicephalus sanguineus]|uniref:neprilysin-21 isoform X2 n=1 Tax=Rhipicephalus sanguineus TaxID=34632 RepID=UPI001894E6BF|nr:neprilysin-21 isoform X2 [Rhipicephalus sanguineus]
MSVSRMAHMVVLLLCVLMYNSNTVGAASGAITLNDEGLTRLLDSKVDPCANFYKHVCGTTRRNSSRLELSPFPGSLQARWLEIQEDISSLLEMPDNVGSRSAEKVLMAFKSCMKEDSAHDVDSLKDLLTDYGISDWPARSGGTDEVCDGGDDMSLPELEALFHYDIVQDKHDKSGHMLSVDRASLPVLYGSLLASNKDPDDEVQPLERERAPKSRENQKERTQGKQEAAGKVFSSNGSNAGSENEARGQDLRSSERRIVQEYEVYIKAVIKSMNELDSFESTEPAKEIVRFETQLAKFAKADTAPQRRSAIYTSLRRLNKEYPTISLSTYFLEKHLRKKGITLQYDTKIYIAEPAYVENVFALLRRTRRYQVKNYVGWKIIATLAPFVSPLRAHHHKFMAEYGFHEKRKQDICTESIAAKASPMRHLVSKTYVERKFSLEAKKNVQLMSELIQRELGTSLSNLRWRTHQARKTALKAVTEMAKLIGYPDWMDNDDTGRTFQQCT